MLKGIIEDHDLVLLPALALRELRLHGSGSDLDRVLRPCDHGLRHWGPGHLHSPPTAMPHAGLLSGPLHLRRHSLYGIAETRGWAVAILCMYVCTYVRTYVRMYVCMVVWAIRLGFRA